MAIRIIIPARYNSSRLPGKPLLLINGEPLIWHVYKIAIKTGIESIVVATDDSRIFDAVEKLGGNVTMTSGHFSSGTDRIAEVAKKLSFADDDVIVNLQGDEPLISPNIIIQVAELLEKNSWADLSTLMCTIKDRADIFNPNVVKVVSTYASEALYFSRAPIPWDRELFDGDSQDFKNIYHKHIGIYAYRMSALQRLTDISDSSLEKCEKLEQLRALQNGFKIAICDAETTPGHGVDTTDDYLRVKGILETKFG